MGERPPLTPEEGSALHALLFDADAVSAPIAGGFGTITRARRRTDGSGVALKANSHSAAAAVRHADARVLPQVLSPSTPAALAAAAAEAALLLRLCSPYVVRCFDAVPLLPDGAASLTVPRLCLVLELCDTDLAKDIAAAWRDGVYCRDAETLTRRAAQLCAGVAYLHGAGVAHRDLKASNCLISGGDVKLGDLGSAAEGAPDAAVTQHGADTAAYRAPEALGASRFNAFRADRWALGVVLVELCAGRLAHSHAPLRDAARASRRERAALAAAAAQHCPAAREVVAGLLRRSPGRRMRPADAAARFTAPPPAEPLSDGASTEDEDSQETYFTDEDVANMGARLRHENAGLRRFAALSLGDAGMMATFHMGTLAALLRDSDAAVRLAAAQSLRKIGVWAHAACPALCAALLDVAAGDAALRRAAAEALGAIDDVATRAEERTDEQQEAHVAPVIDALVAAVAHDPEPEVRAAAGEALRRVVDGAWRLGSGAVDVLRPVCTYAWDEDDAVRRVVRSEVFPLFIEATRGRRSDTWPLTRSMRSAARDADFGVLRL